MAKKQAKTASKNNPSSRVAVKKYFFQGQEVKPTKIVYNTAFMGAENISNGEIIKDIYGAIMSWKAVATNCVLK
ncbi:MAG: hypothetical protein U1E31_00405 [Rickettsiales bacterium]